MSVNRVINTSFWNDTWVETLTSNEKFLYIYLITNSKNNMLGVYEISIKRICFESGLSEGDVKKALESFGRLSKAFYINESYMILTNFTKHQKYNSNMKKAAIKVFNKLPSEIKTIYKSNASEGFERITQWFGIDEIEIEEEIESEIYRAFNHLSISIEENQKLIELGYSQEQVDSIYDSIQNYKKKNNYTSLYLTARKWLKKETPADEEDKSMYSVYWFKEQIKRDKKRGGGIVDKLKAECFERNGVRL